MKMELPTPAAVLVMAILTGCNSVAPVTADQATTPSDANSTSTAPKLDQMAPAAIAAQASTYRDDYKKVSWTKLPAVGWIDYCAYGVTLRRRDAGDTEIDLEFVEASPCDAALDTDWWTSATDSDGNDLSLIQVEEHRLFQYMGEWMRAQHVETILSRDYLQSHQATGISLRLYSDEGTNDVMITPQYLQAVSIVLKQNGW